MAAGADSVAGTNAETAEFYNSVLKFLDPHMAITVLVWLRQRQILPNQDVDAALDALQGVHQLVWVDKALGRPVPPEFVQRQAKFEELYLQMEGIVTSFMTSLIGFKAETANSNERNNSERMTISDFNEKWQDRRAALKSAIAALGTGPEEASRREDLESQLVSYQPFGPHIIEDVRQYTRIFYQAGDYKSFFFRARFCNDVLSNMVAEAARDETLKEDFMWSSILASCLTVPQSLEDPKIDMSSLPSLFLNLSDALDNSAQRPSSGRSPLVEAVGSKKEMVNLMQISCLLHWAVWAIFRYYFRVASGAGRAIISRHTAWTELIDWFFSERSLQCISVICPHLLRYYAVIAILNRRREDHVRTALQGIAANTHKYQDPLTKLVISLFVDCRFDQSQFGLPALAEVCRQDFFIADLKDEIEEQARLLLFDNYCRIHRSININMIADKLHMEAEDAEKWIVNLIRESKLDAKIDSERNVIQMTTHVPNFHEQIIEKTRNQLLRSQALIQNLERLTIGQRFPVS
eukprot:Protomagalhaensia_sp_Gyna_25__5789@NODE_84_length_5393_cov_96_575458_g65_i0_p1_GENE_NODE_84_length_5393_cov_96_575458_g65_i0NODE_84_length_5393_cov_96_575458_g65_i0_p1_ORF_typecomplete_len521_score104_36PCI/PF01399_27/5_9e17PCI/PF01399_27/1_4e04eIF3_N/PF09440_10/0_014BLOC1S3/PF15753_5/3_2e03BLOC1S3/PF15753_5/0_57DDRGK/PF09756_9/2_3e03DDRGK/PF09756_9/0_31_NODE_84_length_5393_cov_96_575458_g65_i038015363